MSNTAEGEHPAYPICEPAIREHTFQETIQDVRVYMQIIMMQGSCIVWVGTGAASFAALEVAMKTHMDPVPICSTLMGSANDSPGAPLATRLALKFGLQAFVSVNVPSTQPLLQAAIEKRLMTLIEGILSAASPAAEAPS